MPFLRRGRSVSEPQRSDLFDVERDRDLEENSEDDRETLNDIAIPDATNERVITNEKTDPNLVEFEGPNDKGDPRNWGKWKRINITVSLGLMTFTVTCASSIFSDAVAPISEEYHIGETTATLGTSLFLLGFVLGPLIFGPMSEVYGRRYPLLMGQLGFAVFQIPVAVARNVETIMLGRFFSGFAASAPLAIVGGCLADIWGPVERAYAMCAFAGGGFGGPVVGPVLGGFITQSKLGWRWTAWITLIMASAVGVYALIFVPETSPNKILQYRAAEMRHRTKNWALHSKADESRVTLKTICTVYLVRPFVMIVKEPILALMTAYMSYLYGIIYLLFEGFPISFHEQRGWNIGVSSLPFTSFLVGIFLGCALMIYSTKTGYKAAYVKFGKSVPELRLPPMIVGALVLPVAFLWYGWTSYPSITWVPQVISVAFMGFGLFLAFWQGVIYIIDCYGPYANSAIAINTFIRSIAAAGFPLFAPFMYRGMGVPWASTLLGLVCLVFAPAPILFYKYGSRIRAKSTFAPSD